MAFWMPAHLPAASGPASVCVTAQTLEVKMPSDNEAAMSRPNDIERSATKAADSMSAAHSKSPVMTKVFRTRVGVPPPGNPAIRGPSHQQWR